MLVYARIQKFFRGGGGVREIILFYFFLGGGGPRDIFFFKGEGTRPIFGILLCEFYKFESPPGGVRTLRPPLPLSRSVHQVKSITNIKGDHEKETLEKNGATDWFNNSI